MVFGRCLGEYSVLFWGNSHECLEFSGEEAVALKSTGCCNFVDGQVLLSQKLGGVLHTNSMEVLKYSLAGVFLEQTTKVIRVNVQLCCKLFQGYSFAEMVI